MNDQESENLSEFNAYDLKISSLAEISQIHEDQLGRIETIRIMHSPSLTSLRGLERFYRLQEVNLSSNNIERMETLEKLTELTILDLSCNKIRVVNGLLNLFKLEKLNLSHNKIINIQNLKQIAGEKFNLKYLDLSDNKIQDYKEMLVLNNLPNLENLFFEMGKSSNPICKKRDYYHEVLQNLKIFDKLQIIDGISPENFMNQPFPQREKEEKENTPVFEKNIPSPKTQNPFQSSPFEVTSLKTKNFPAQIQRPEDYPTKSIEKEFAAKEIEYKAENCNLKRRMEEMISDQRELIYKYEMSENFWSAKCEKMERDYFQLTNQVKSQKKELKRLATENVSLKNDLDLSRKENKEFQLKKERKDEMVENLQERISVLLKENGELQKEVKIRLEDIEKSRRDIKTLEDTNKELRASIRENERILSDFHSKSLENASFTLQRGEEMKRKFESIYEENKVLMSENSELKQKMAALTDLAREWEIKFDSKVNEMQFEFERETKKLVDEYEKQIFQMTHHLSFGKKEQEVEFKKNLDMLEEEFKKVLNENNEKFRQIKISYEEKLKSESDLKNLLRAALMKNSEQEATINDFEHNLFKIKKEVTEMMSERDFLQKELAMKKNIKEKEFDYLKEENARLENEKKLIEGNFNKLKDFRNQENSELADLRNKMMIFDSVSNDIEDLKIHIETKTKLLDDKNETIENLKEENEQLKQNQASFTEDYTKLSKKIEKQNDIIEELEQQISGLQEENQKLQKDLKDKKNIIKIFEEELENIRHTQETEVIDLKEDIQNKNEKIKELLKTLDECKASIQKSQETIKEKEKLRSEIELQALYTENEYKNKLKLKEKETEALKLKIEESEDEMKILIIEIEKQKRMAKENIEKLNKIFNI